MKRLLLRPANWGFCLSEYDYANVQQGGDGFYQDTNETMTEYGKPAIFFTLEINALPEDKFQALLQDSQVAYYAPWLKRVRMFKPYELSEDIEALLADKALTSSAAWVRLYDETASKLKYVVDGKEYNDAEISKLLQDKDPLVREKAGKELNRVNKENGELFTFIYNMIVKDGAIEDEKRGFKSPIASRNLSNRVEDEVVDTLAETVRSKYKDIAERFYKLKAKWLGKEKSSIGTETRRCRFLTIICTVGRRALIWF